MVLDEMELIKERVTIHGIEVQGEFAVAVKQAVAMNQLQYSVQIHKSKHHEAEKWCKQNLGPRWEVTGNRNGTWCCFWAGRENFGCYNYHFANERDMVWFSLKFTS